MSADVYFFDCDKPLYDYDFRKRLPRLAVLSGVSQYRLASRWCFAVEGERHVARKNRIRRHLRVVIRHEFLLEDFVKTSLQMFCRHERYVAPPIDQ